MKQIETAASKEVDEPKANAVAPEVPLPVAVRERMNGQLEGQTIVAWSEFDIDAAGKYRQQFVVLTEECLIVLSDGEPKTIAVSSIESAKINEGVGLDELRAFAGGKLATTVRYSRKHRREMTRLQRKLERRLPSSEVNDVELTDLLEHVEREAEKKETCAKCGQIIPAYAEGVCPRCLHQRKILWRLLDVAKPYRMKVWIALSLTMVMSGIATLPPICQKYFIDTALEPRGKGGAAVYMPLGQRVHNMFFWGAMTLIVIVVVQSLAVIRLKLLTTLGSVVARDLRHQVYAHLHELSLRFFNKRRTGSLITRVTSDTDRLWDFIVFGSVNLIRDVAMIVIFAVVMFCYNWQLAVAALLPLPALAIITYYRSMKMQAMFGRLWTYWSRLTAVVGDALPGVKVVKAFANEGREVVRFDRRSEEYTSHELETNQVWATLQPIIGGTMMFGRLLVWIVGGYLIITQPSEKNTFGTLVMFTGFLLGFYEPIMELANSNRMVTRAASSAQRVFEVLDTPPDIYSTSKSIRKPTFEGNVEFRNVSFSYEGAQPALRDVSLKVEAGQMIGLCGPSGAGKSTFVNLLCRFFDVTDGQILIDGIDIRDYDVKWLRRQIGMVLQEPYLFHGTIADNIRYGNPEADHAEIIRAAKAANAHDFIVGFPDGYDTMVGERGQSLSGGERQRISIARAILHNPRLLILDEATSSVDTETEKQIQQALDRLVEGRTTFAIAHRLSTLQAADRLIVLEKGRIVEQGLHAELVDKKDGVYAKLHKTQMEMSNLVAIR
jgi:ATP-binding cassette subfamily B protein